MPSQGPPPGAHVTYSRQYRRCNRPGCSVCAEGRGHGPYWYAFWREGSRQRSRYLGKDLPEAERAAVRGAAAAVVSAAPVAETGALRVRSLGGLKVYRGTHDLRVDTWRPRTATLLFACLLSAPGQRLRRDDLAEMLWPEGETGAVRGNLRVAIHHLRKLLGKDATGRDHLHQEGAFLCLAPLPDGQQEGGWLDAVAFERVPAVIPKMDRAACRDALALYGGDYLPEYASEEWAVARREVLAERYLALLLHLAALAERAGEQEEAADCLRQVLGRDPCREMAARALMRLEMAAGRHEMAVRTYRNLALAMRRELGLVPDQETDAQYQAALEARLRAVRARNNLPSPSTSFIGRAVELAALEDLLDGVDGDGNAEAAPRLVTLVGPGGVGKSRLAVEVGRTVLPSYHDGVWLVELAGMPPDGEAAPLPVARQVCAAIGLREERRQDALAALLAHLGPRQALLLLDNCEHLAPACAALVATLLAGCPGLRVLATSREELGLVGEQIWQLEPLPTPVEGRQARLTLKQLIGHGAVRLFLERGRAARQGFVLSEGNRAQVVAICARLDGIPLAIELAATRLAILAAEDVAAHLDDRFRLLAGGNRGAPPRHQTLRAVLDWSYDLLGEGERRLLRALAVFSDGWRLPAAEVVCTGNGTEGREVLDLLSGLVHKSLVQAHEDGEGGKRYRLLETVRVYALEQLEAAGEADAVRERHTAWCLVLAEDAALGLVGPHQGEWLAQLESEHDNLRAALRWLLSMSDQRLVEWGARLAAALWRFWSLAGYVVEGRRWLAAALQQRTLLPLTLQARVLHGAGKLAFDQADYAQAADLTSQALALQRRLNDRPRIAASLITLGNVAWALGNWREATASYEHSLAIWREVGDSHYIALCIDNMGAVAAVQKDFARARALHQESLAIRQRIGDAHGTALALYNLSALAFEQHDWPAATDLLRQAAVVWRDMGARRDLAGAVVQFAMFAQARGSLERAVLLLAAGEQLRLLTGEGLRDEDEAEIAQTMQALREQLSEPSFAAAWAAGQTMSLEEALAYALDEAPAPAIAERAL